MQTYCKTAGRPYPIQGWPVAVSFSFFRLAVITQGIAARSLRGQASSEEAALVAKGFKPLGHLAEKVAKDYDAEIKSGKTKL